MENLSPYPDLNTLLCGESPPKAKPPADRTLHAHSLVRSHDYSVRSGIAPAPYYTLTSDLTTLKTACCLREIRRPQHGKQGNIFTHEAHVSVIPIEAA